MSLEPLPQELSTKLNILMSIKINKASFEIGATSYEVCLRELELNSSQANNNGYTVYESNSLALEYEDEGRLTYRLVIEELAIVLTKGVAPVSNENPGDGEIPNFVPATQPVFVQNDPLQHV